MHDEGFTFIDMIVIWTAVFILTFMLAQGLADQIREVRNGQTSIDSSQPH